MGQTPTREIHISVGPLVGRPLSGKWTKGYSQQELDDAQARFGLKFPPDLIALYRDRRPLDGYDWTRDDQAIREMLAWPFEGLWFDVEHANLWWPEWGDKPADAKDRQAVLRRVVDSAPKLIPILSHRYLPEEPQEAGNPVFSVYQSDVIYYGANLEDYFAREFNGWNSRPWPNEIKRIRFWSTMVERNGD